MKFDIEEDSRILRELIGKYETDGFLGQIAILLPMIGPPIPYRPFNALDSPMKMLTYMGGLNIYAETSERIPYKFDHKEWEKIIKQMVKVKAGYYDKFLPGPDDDHKKYYDYYKVSMPVFMDYFDTGPTNYEEQEIERIQRMFASFEKEIFFQFGLSINDFIAIYNEIDQQLLLNNNRYLTLLENPICKEFWGRMKTLDILPAEWKYEGNEADLIELIKGMQHKEEKYKIRVEDLYHYGKDKVDGFLSLFLCKKDQGEDYLYYTSENIIMAKPLFRLNDGRILVLLDKQILSAIFNLLNSFCKSVGKNGDRLYKKRGNYLQEKIIEVLKTYFGKEAFIYEEYKLHPKAQDRQDVLLLCKGLSLVIEAKAGDRVEPHAKAMKAYEQVYRNFSRNIQKGYDQAFRIKSLFDNKTDFDIYNDKEIFNYRVKTKNYHSVFSLIVTLDKFGPVQTDITKILNLHEGDNVYPLSICIDDLETLLLSMKKMKKGQGDLIQFLKWREKMQGRVKTDDELSIWGTFLTNPKFKPASDPDMHFIPGEKAHDLFDELYNKGLGFVNEKNIDKKKSSNWIVYNPAKISEYISGKRPI